MSWTVGEIGWPWLCLGGGLRLFAVMLGPDLTRSEPGKVSRWHHPVWLAWLLVPVLMVHMFEEYGLDIYGRAYEFPAGFCTNLGLPAYPACPIPRVHYPLVNLGIAWIGAPIAALFARRNLIIGLSWYGLLLVNGITHIVGVIVAGSNGVMGVVSGTLFIPLTIWVAYATLKTGALSRSALAVSLAGGVIAHLTLFATVLIMRATVPAALLIGDLVVIVLPLAIAGAGSTFFPKKRWAARYGRPAL
jgi:hypothetical protein